MGEEEGPVRLHLSHQPLAVGMEEAEGEPAGLSAGDKDARTTATHPSVSAIQPQEVVDAVWQNVTNSDHTTTTGTRTAQLPARERGS